MFAYPEPATAMNQDDLFPGEGYGNGDNGEAYARWSDPETSHDAAKEVKGNRATKLEMEAYKVLLEELDNNEGGLINDQIVERSGYPWKTITPRLAPLCRKGLAFDSGNRRKGQAGKYQVVWKAIRTTTS
jgi:hypothetical protein